MRGGGALLGTEKRAHFSSPTLWRKINIFPTQKGRKKRGQETFEKKGEVSSLLFSSSRKEVTVNTFPEIAKGRGFRIPEKGGSQTGNRGGENACNPSGKREYLLRCNHRKRKLYKKEGKLRKKKTKELLSPALCLRRGEGSFKLSRDRILSRRSGK